MSGSNGHTPGERDEEMIVAAAEYALGLTAGEERRRAAERAARDPGFAREVAFWQQRAALLPADADTAPQEHVWSAIRDRIAGIDDGLAATSPGQAPGFWRWAAIGASGIAAAAAIALAVILSAPAPEPLVATLQSEQGPHVTLVVEPEQRRIIASTLGTDPQGRVPELWLLPPGEDPISLGVIAYSDHGAGMTIPEPLAEHLHAGAKLAVSLEPAGGSPTGGPTGPVIAQATLQRL